MLYYYWVFSLKRRIHIRAYTFSSALKFWTMLILNQANFGSTPCFRPTLKKLWTRSKFLLTHTQILLTLPTYWTHPVFWPMSLTYPGTRIAHKTHASTESTQFSRLKNFVKELTVPCKRYSRKSCSRNLNFLKNCQIIESFP